MNRPDSANIYYDYQPTGVWWKRAMDFVTPIQLPAPEQVAGVPLQHHAHRADVLRLQVIKQYGGIYLDTDVLCVRPFHPLRDHTVVLGDEEEPDVEGLGNAVILAEPGARFIERWIDGYDPKLSLWEGFRSRGYDQYWDEMSVKYPAHLAMKFPDEITVVPAASFYRPSWTADGLRTLFEAPRTAEEASEDTAYCHHLWEMEAWPAHLASLRPSDVLAGRAMFHKLASRYVAEFAD